MRSFVAAVPLSALAFAIVVAVSVAASRAVARWLGVDRVVAALTVLGFGTVVAATLVPTVEALDGVASSGVCDFSRVGLAPLEELLTVTASSLNVLLFVPLGFAVGLLPWTRSSALVVGAAVSLTFVVEGLQLVVTPLGRGCQTADMFDNLLGLVIGATAGVAVHAVSIWSARMRG